MTGNKNKKQRAGKQRGRNSLVGGDIPKPGHYTHTTMSCHIPRISETCVVRASGSTVITTTPISDLKTNFAFQLLNANVGTGFWDQYRIAAIRFVVAPQNNAIGLVTNSTTTLVPMYIVIDYDDTSSLASAADAQSYSTCLVLHPGESCERIFKPRVAIAAYNGSFGGYANFGDVWIDAASNTVQHYGVKTLVPGVVSGQTLLQSWDVTVEYFIEFRKSI